MADIFINTSSLLGPRTGIGNYTLQIAKRLIPTPGLNFTFFDGHYTRELPQNTPCSITGKQSDVLKFLKKFPRFFNLLRDVQRKLQAHTLKNRHFDLYFEPNFLTLPVPARRTIITIHDFSFHLHSDWHPRDRVLYFKKHFWKSIRHAQHFIFDSNFIRNSAVQDFGFAQEHCTVIYNGVDHTIFRPRAAEEILAVKRRYLLPESFILFVGSVEPRKNLKNVLNAYISLPDSIKRDVKFLIAGFSGWRNTDIMHMLQANSKDIRYLGYIPEDHLACLYSMAKVFVYPSFYEGFGLPPLEAMACGAPVIVSNTSSMPEVCGNAAVYITPKNVAQIASTILNLLKDHDLRKTLSEAGRRRATLFSWDKAAEAHLQLFYRLLKED
ncbi:MAG: glycosyltransferase family 1 protein [Dissulfuribacterales bacterium]